MNSRFFSLQIEFELLPRLATVTRLYCKYLSWDVIDVSCKKQNLPLLPLSQSFCKPLLMKISKRNVIWTLLLLCGLCCAQFCRCCLFFPRRVLITEPCHFAITFPLLFHNFFDLRLWDHPFFNLPSRNLLQTTDVKNPKWLRLVLKSKSLEKNLSNVVL